MSASLSVERLRADGFRLSINGDKLHVEPIPPPDLLARMRSAKPELLAELRRQSFAVIANENAAEYVAEREAICAADGLPPAMLRPVYRCTLRGNRPFIVLGRVGETQEQARAGLKAQFGGDFIALETHQRSASA